MAPKKVTKAVAATAAVADNTEQAPPPEPTSQPAGKKRQSGGKRAATQAAVVTASDAPVQPPPTAAATAAPTATAAAASKRKRAAPAKPTDVDAMPASTAAAADAGTAAGSAAAPQAADTKPSKRRKQPANADEQPGQAAPARKRGKKPGAAAAGAEGAEEGEAARAAGGMPITGLWLMKNEPEELSLDILKSKPNQTWYWDGVRNYQARNFMRQMKIGDRILFYYSSCKVPGIAGIAKVVKLAYPDHTAWDPKSPYYDAKSTPDNPRWDMVDVQYVEALPRFLTLEELRRHSGPGGMLQDMYLFSRFRLSVQPVSQVHWDRLMQLAQEQPE